MKQAWSFHVGLALGIIAFTPHMIGAQVTQLETKSPNGPKLDRNGDPLPAGAIARLGTVRFRHGCGIDELTFSQRGDLLASFAYDDSLMLWSVRSGRMVLRLELPSRTAGRAGAVALSPDMHYLAEGRKGLIRLWDLSNGKSIKELKGHDTRISGLVYAPDGKQLVSVGSDGSVAVWDLSAEKIIARWQLPKPKARVSWQMHWTKDGKLLVCGKRQRTNKIWEAEVLGSWDVGSGKALSQGSAQDIWFSAFSADGQTCFLGNDKNLTSLQTETFQVKNSISGSHSLTAIALSSDGKEIACANWGGEVEFREADTLAQPRTLEVPGINSRAIALSPNLKYLAVAFESGAIQLWDLEKRKRIDSPGSEATQASFAFVQGGKSIVSLSNGSVSWWESRTGNLLREAKLDPPGFRLAVSPNGNYLAALHHKGWGLFDSRGTNLMQQTQDEHTHAFLLTFTDDNRLVIAWARYGEFSGLAEAGATVWDPAKRKELHSQTIPLPAKPTLSIPLKAISPDGRYMDSVSAQQGEIPRATPPVDLWDLATGKKICRIGKDDIGVELMGFSTDSKTLVTCNQFRPGHIQLWEVATGQERWQASKGQEFTRINVIAMSPDERLLAAGTADGRIRLWDLSAGKELPALPGHRNGWVQSVLFSPDGSILASAAADTTILVWDMTKLLPNEGRLVVPSNEDSKAAWDKLLGSDAASAYKAMWQLTAAPEVLVTLARETFSKQSPPGDRQGPEEIVDQAKLSPLQLQAFRTLEVLERIDRPDAREVMRSMAKDAPSKFVRREAQMSLDRASRRTQ